MRALVLVSVMVAGAAAAGCGKDSSPSPAPPQSPAPDPNANPTSAQPSPAPSPDQPSPSPSPSPAPDRFVTIERLDSASECDALVPTNVPAPVSARIDPPPSPGGCGGGVSEGTGHVAVGIRASPRGSEYQVFGPDGHPEQRFSITSELWPQPEGWQGLQASSSGVPLSVDLLTFFADGSPRRSERPQPSGFVPRSSAAGPDPQGGALIVQAGPTGSGDCFGEARRFDATGAPSGAPGRVGCDVFAAGVSNAGEALVLESTATGTQTRWLRADGTPASAPAPDPARPVGQLKPLLDGSLTVLQGASFTRSYAHLAPASEPAPAWLAARSGQTFRFTRGNKGYAFFPPPGQQSSDCTQAVELVAPSGRRCVKLTFRRDGNACITGFVDQGWDGTVVQQTGISACGWRFWPRLLAGG